MGRPHRIPSGLVCETDLPKGRNRRIAAGRNQKVKAKHKTWMSTSTETITGLVQSEYKYGFITDVETDAAPPGLNEDIIRLISRKKREPDWLLEWRLRAYRHWTMMQT